MVYFQNKNTNLGIFLFGGGGLGMENVGICYGHLEYLGYFGDILRPSFGRYIFPHFGVMYQEKYSNPELKCVFTRNTNFQFVLYV
jgi:hypothetical protein